MPDLRAICVYAGSSSGRRPAYAEAARDLGRTVAERDLTLVYGGGAIGLMGDLADAALDAGGRVIGVIPRTLQEREVGHDRLTELRVVESMHERKLAMAELSDAFVALPGGIGTLEELIEVQTWTQLGVHEKPCAVLDVEGYWGPLIGLLDHAVSEGFLSPDHRAIMLQARTPDELLAALQAWSPPPLEHWLDSERA